MYDFNVNLKGTLNLLEASNLKVMRFVLFQCSIGGTVSNK